MYILFKNFLNSPPFTKTKSVQAKLARNKMIEGEQRLVSTTQRKKKKIKNSKRFTDEQIKSMETIFKVEAKLEPRKKLQMARELGLQPRQVAIWFQNKRARWKSKQIEQEFRSLKADYDDLDSRFQSLQKEKQSLLVQIQKLRDQLNTAPGEGVRESKELEGNNTDSCSENGDTKFQLKGKSSSLSEGVDKECMRMYSDDELDRRMNGYDVAERGDIEFHSFSTTEQVDGFSEPTAERISDFELDGGFFDDQTCATQTWWDFWI